MKHSTRRMPGHGLELCVHRFSREARPPADRTVLLLHGFMDAGGTWHDVAKTLCDRGIEVWAPDFRGFGRSDRVSGGGYYHFANYVADIAVVIQQIAASDLTIAGHSMGGTVAVYYAGARPGTLQRLVLLEGIGPPDMPASTVHPRMKLWLDALDSPRQNKPLQSIDDAVRRLSRTHSNIDRAALARIAPHLVVERDGELSWAFDALHRSASPGRFDVAAFNDFLDAIACPTLFISGGKTGLHPSDEQDRIDRIADARAVTLEGAGHMMHWTEPEATATAIADFISS